jgi:hypothetical protein
VGSVCLLAHLLDLRDRLAAEEVLAVVEERADAGATLSQCGGERAGGEAFEERALLRGANLRPLAEGDHHAGDGQAAERGLRVHRGGYIELNKFRWRQWTPALRAADIEHRRIYDLRHTFCSWALRDGVSLFLLSRIMGTSIALLDSTYGHLAPDSEEHIRALLDTGDRQRLGHVRATEPEL